LELIGGLFKKLSMPLQSEIEPAFAEVVTSAFCQDGGEFVRHTFEQRGDVFIDELFLQRDGEGADQYPAALATGQIDGRDQVRDALTHAGSSLDRQVPPVDKRLLNRTGHPNLFGTHLETAKRFRDRPTRGQNLGYV
jgi:threonine synthase